MAQEKNTAGSIQGGTRNTGNNTPENTNAQRPTPDMSRKGSDPRGEEAPTNREDEERYQTRGADQRGKQGGTTGGQLGTAQGLREERDTNSGTPRPDHGTEEEEGTDARRTRAEGDTSQDLRGTGGGTHKTTNTGKKPDLH